MNESKDLVVIAMLILVFIMYTHVLALKTIVFFFIKISFSELNSDIFFYYHSERIPTIYKHGRG